MIQGLMGEKNALLQKLEGNEESRKSDLQRIKKLSQDVNALSGVEEENSQLRAL